MLSASWRVVAAAAVLLWCAETSADDVAALVAGRTAIERVYYEHRLGAKPPFQEAVTPAALEKMVRQDLRKEAMLQKAYGIVITPALLEAEVQRINAATQAPEMLAEIKAALGNDPGRFANAFAKPFLVERLLRERFENDDALHAPQRRACETVRNDLLAAKRNGATLAQLLAQLRQAGASAVTETTWQLGAPPAKTSAPAADELEIRKRFGPNAQLLSSPAPNGKERKLYFENLPPALQKVLRVQLRQPGDISAVIETPGGFLLYLARGRSDRALAVAGLALPKRNYDQWLENQH